eukprot:CAMPEP_0174693964 /NCGR_PEP_ID=MMETSP1094-20130205/611_1 /TAXON_ID=156173 /ORGANISM="Chrysochromulina brevifilum, Strain UTEX LB 985" /LENGTH=320 /DNA_ID=CAMNT_0015890047 /DNA_START=165 /DNA_END=1127 /DNA_ORIENTATION=+
MSSELDPHGGATQQPTGLTAAPQAACHTTQLPSGSGSAAESALASLVVRGAGHWRRAHSHWHTAPRHATRAEDATTMRNPQAHPCAPTKRAALAAAALLFAARLVKNNLLRVAGWLRPLTALLNVLPRDNAVDLNQDGLERCVDVGRIHRRGLDESQVILLSETLRIICQDRLQVLQIALVSHEHDHDGRVGVRAELLEPPLHVLKREPLRDVIHEQGANCTAVVSACDGAVPLLAGRVPDLCLDNLAVMLDAARRELDADCGLGVEMELIAREPAEQVGLADTRVANDDHLEQVVVVIVWSGRCACRQAVDDRGHSERT